jgi:WD40 repeat protein
VGLAVLLIVALVAGTVALVQQRNADQQAGRATHSAALARSTQLATLARTMPATQNDLALLLGVEGRRLQPSRTTDGGLETAITHRPPHLERVLHFDTTASYATMSDNGRLLAVPGIDGNIRIYDFTTGRLRRTLQGEGPPALVAAFNHDASLVATGSASGKVTIWRVATGKPIGPPVVPGGTVVYGIFDRTDELVTVSDNGSIAQWDLRNPAHPIPIGEPFTAHVGMNDLPVVAFGGADGRLMAAGGLTEQRTTMWDVTTHRQVGNELPGTPGRFSPDGSIITTTSANRVLLWDAATGAQRGTLDLGAHGVASAPPVFSADGRLLAAANADDNAIRVFDIASEQPISEPLAFHAASAAPMTFLPAGRLVTAGANEAAVWQLETLARPLETIVNGNHGETVGTVSAALGQFTPDGTEVITVGFADHRVLAWDAVTGAPHGDLLGGQIATVGRIDFSPDAKTIVSAGLDGTFTLWDRTVERRLATVATGQTGLVGVAWDPNRPVVVTTGAPGSVLFWDVSNPRHPVEQRRRALTAPAGFPTFSPDGRFLVIVGGGPPATSATVFDVATGHKVLDFGGGATLPQVSFTPDSATLAAVMGQFNSTGKVVLWDTSTWHRRATLILPYSPGGIAFINGGTRFATPSILPAIGRIDLWDTATLQPVGEPLTAPTTESLFSNADARGSKIAIGSYSGITTVLDVNPRSWQRAACRLAGRNLTRTEWKQYVPGQSYRKTCPQWPAGR